MYYKFWNEIGSHILFEKKCGLRLKPLADPGSGGRPPTFNGRGPMIFNAYFPWLFFACFVCNSC